MDTFIASCLFLGGMSASVLVACMIAGAAELVCAVFEAPELREDDEVPR